MVDIKQDYNVWIKRINCIQHLMQGLMLLGIGVASDISGNVGMEWGQQRGTNLDATNTIEMSKYWKSGQNKYSNNV